VRFVTSIVRYWTGIGVPTWNGITWFGTAEQKCWRNGAYLEYRVATRRHPGLESNHFHPALETLLTPTFHVCAA